MVMRLAYSVKEAVEASRLSQRQLYLMMDRGDLRYTKVGRRRLIPASALREVVGETEQAA